MEFSHFDSSGRPKMVSVGAKADTDRVAIARGRIRMARETLMKIREREIGKGDVLAAAQIAGIMGAKRTAELIPMCHTILITGVDMDFDLGNDYIDICARVTCTGKTGVEMEALTAVNVAALTVYDMCKAIDRGMVIEQVYLARKDGGKSGSFVNPHVHAGRVRDVNLSREKGTVKTPVESAEFVENFGIRGDAHAGKWHRQISLLAAESADQLRQAGMTLHDGDFAENITTEGIRLHELPVGTVLKAGPVLLRVTQIGKECHQDCEIKKLVGRCVMPTEGIFAEVLSGGILRRGDSIEALR